MFLFVFPIFHPQEERCLRIRGSRTIERKAFIVNGIMCVYIRIFLYFLISVFLYFTLILDRKRIAIVTRLTQQRCLTDLITDPWRKGHVLNQRLFQIEISKMMHFSFCDIW